MSSTPPWAAALVRYLRARGYRATWNPREAHVVCRETVETDETDEVPVVEGIAIDDVTHRVSAHPGQMKRRRWHLTLAPGANPADVACRLAAGAPTQMTTLRLTQDERATLRSAGDGDMTAGLRRLLDDYS